MSVNLIPMLTWNDVTVEDAFEVFENSKNAPAKHWGFKKDGIKPEDATILVKRMKSAGKEVFFEALVEEEHECVDAAKFALEHDFDYLMGVEYFESVVEVLKGSSVELIPSCGRKEGMPRKLYGTIEEIVTAGVNLQDKGVYGIILSPYRYQDGDPAELTDTFVNAVKLPIFIAGSVNSNERLDVMKRINPWGFTIGSAFFENNFGEGLTFGEQISKVVDYLNN
ncbi:MAG: hypothetical protein HOE30_16820 [Deltaproteobacteria bacterium]|jgi:uncharacterized protein related to proFAR isomerase|nr:hypothetical protein [Deltaproteobacteria bacterium]MBT4642894.1 hypothetical protein [Deltaproteobacteria bacterium]